MSSNDKEQTKKVPVVVKRKSGSNSSSVNSVAQTMQHQSEHGVPSDVLGSYTGTPIDGLVPEQDADDL